MALDSAEIVASAEAAKPCTPHDIALHDELGISRSSRKPNGDYKSSNQHGQHG